VAYKLQSFDSASIHPIFQVSQLKLSLKCGVAVTALPLGMEVGDSNPPPRRPFSQPLKIDAMEPHLSNNLFCGKPNHLRRKLAISSFY